MCVCVAGCTHSLWHLPGLHYWWRKSSLFLRTALHTRGTRELTLRGVQRSRSHWQTVWRGVEQHLERIVNTVNGHTVNMLNKKNHYTTVIFYLVQQILSINCCIDILSHSSACGAFQGASQGIYSTGQGWRRWWHGRKKLYRWRRAIGTTAALPHCPSCLASWTGYWSPW